ncbi:MAG: hypothetical protein MUF49_11415 [Oculatellaceae cyanobacterium Prado106]|jgi:hypothetical protein|nr:hypothetical protein [Oculatellaceae cyanobacterium Prado106]
MTSVSLAQVAWELAIALNLDLPITRLILQNKTIHVLNLGMGVESTAIAVRWILESHIRPFQDFDQLIIQIAQTGNEMQETQQLIETYLFPLFRRHQIRCIQVAKRGSAKAEGYEILEDSYQPTTCFIEGSYKLFDHLAEAGTVPRLGRPHACAQRWKGEVLDALLQDKILMIVWLWILLKILTFQRYPQMLYWEVIAPCFFGPYLGYNYQEQSRIRKVDEYRCRGTRFLFPLNDWQWTRDDCVEYLYWVFQVHWQKSACQACPFLQKRLATERYRRDPEAGGAACFSEAIALSINPEMHLFSFGTAYRLLQEDENAIALAHYDRLLEQTGWALYKVDRLYVQAPSGRKDSKRRVNRLVVGTLAELQEQLVAIAQSQNLGLSIDLDQRFWRVYEFTKSKTLPTFESFWVIAPAKVKPKVQYAEKFSDRWEAMTGNPDPFRPETASRQLQLF